MSAPVALCPTRPPAVPYPVVPVKVAETVPPRTETASTVPPLHPAKAPAKLPPEASVDDTLKSIRPKFDTTPPVPRFANSPRRPLPLVVRLEMVRLLPLKSPVQLPPMGVQLG